MIISVVGLGKFGYKLAIMLQRKGAEVIAIDNNPQIIDRIKDQVTKAIVCDITNEKALEDLGLEESHVAVLSLGSYLEEAIIGLVQLKKMGIPKIIARAISSIQENVLLAVGAQEVFSLETEMSDFLSSQILDPFLRKKVTFLEEYTVIEFVIPSSLDGKKFQDLNIKEVKFLGYGEYQIDLDENGSIKRKLLFKETIQFLKSGDILLLGGTSSSINEILEVLI